MNRRYNMQVITPNVLTYHRIFHNIKKINNIGPSSEVFQDFYLSLYFLFFNWLQGKQGSTNECCSSNQKSYMKTLCKKERFIPTRLITAMYMYSTCTCKPKLVSKWAVAIWNKYAKNLEHAVY